MYRSIRVSIVYPDGTEHEANSSSALKFTTQVKGGVTTYDVRHEATHAGTHQVQITLNGTPIRGSPVKFDVSAASADVKSAQLSAPVESPLYSNHVYSVVLKTFDRFHNPVSHGGLAVVSRLQWIKSGVHDLTTLMATNHSVEVEDNEDGTYSVHVKLVKISGQVRVFVNMDKNIPASGGELPPVTLAFLPDTDASTSGSNSAEHAGEVEEKAVESIVADTVVSEAGTPAAQGTEETALEDAHIA